MQLVETLVDNLQARLCIIASVGLSMDDSLGDRVVVTMSGDFDASNVAQLRSTGLRAVTAATGRRTMLDLAQVNFLDSAALGALLDINNCGVATNTEVLLVSVPDPIIRLLELTGLTGVLRYVEPDSPTDGC